MNKIFSLLVLLSLTFSIHAQKVKFEKLGRLAFIKPPKELKLQEFKTYFVSVNVPNDDGLVKSGLKNAIRGNLMQSDLI